MSKEECEELCERMCDQYCRYPRELASDDLLMAVCRTCPMNKLIEKEDDA